MARYVFDIETDGLLVEASRMWLIGFVDVDTNELFMYRGFQEAEWMEKYLEADELIGHNIMGFDIPAIQKLYGVVPNCKCTDTLLYSQILNYRRFGYRGHSLDVWGDKLGFPKLDFKAFEEYSEEMEVYCANDILLNLKVYKELEKEINKIKPGGKLERYINVEHTVSAFGAAATVYGWPFDVEKAKELEVILEEKMNEAYHALSQRLGKKCVAVDKVKGEVPYKEPKRTKIGFYQAHVARWFDIEPVRGHPEADQPIAGPYSRVKFKDLSLDSVTDVKIFLYRNGWEPTEWNYKRVHGERGRMTLQKMSPKITEESLEFLEGDGKLYLNFLVARSRHSILSTWLESVDDNGHVHGGMQTIGTPSMRARHSGIVNVTSINSAYGKEIRSLFISEPGWVIVGCDSSGNQARGLAHYLKSQEYIDILLNGDIHSYNAKKLTECLRSMGINHEVSRSASKRVFYALLFGAGGTKLWLYIFNEINTEKGSQLRELFFKSVPGFHSLVNRLEKMYKDNKKKVKRSSDSYIVSIAGNRIYVDSKHKLLVYLLQSCEKITCASAVYYTVTKLEEEGIDYIPLIFYHDEFQIMVEEKNAKRAKEIGEASFREAPKWYGIEIMDGAGEYGKSWLETH